MSNHKGAREVNVQHKYCCKDAWRQEIGDQMDRISKPDYTMIYAGDERELKALEDFIAYKERCIQRFQHVEVNRDAKEEAIRLKQYRTEFPTKDRDADHISLPFWPSNALNVEDISGGNQKEGSSDPFPPFNPQFDINMGQFVGLSVVQEEVESEVPFYLGKVIEEGKNSWRMKIKVC